MRKLILLASVLAIYGCAAPVWYRDNTSQAQFEKDKSYCEYEAMKYTNTYDPTMQTGIGQGLSLAIRRSELGTACMQQLGYRQVKQNAPSQPPHIDMAAFPPSDQPSPSTPSRVLSKDEKYARKTELLTAYLACVSEGRKNQSQMAAEAACTPTLKQYREAAYQAYQADEKVDVLPATQAAEDQAVAMARAAAAPAPLANKSPMRAPNSARPSVADELRKLADLHAQGAITEAEFNAAKARVLAK